MSRSKLGFVLLVVLSVGILITSYYVDKRNKEIEIKRIEEHLEELLGEDMTYSGVFDEYNDVHSFTTGVVDESSISGWKQNIICVDKESYEIVYYNHRGNENPAFVETNGTLEERIIETTMKMIPSLFEYDYTIEVDNDTGEKALIYQLDDDGLFTGNNIYVGLEEETITNVSINNDYNPEEDMITKDEAIEAAYSYANAKIPYIRKELSKKYENYKYSADIDDKDNHIVTAELKFDDYYLDYSYVVEINNVTDNRYEIYDSETSYTDFSVYLNPYSGTITRIYTNIAYDNTQPLSYN